MNAQLLDRALHGLRNATLPSGDVRTFGAAASGSTCALCERSISGSVEILLESETADLRVVLHPECHIAWEMARHLRVLPLADSLGGLPYAFPW